MNQLKGFDMPMSLLGQTEANQLAESGGVCIQGSVYEAVPGRMAFDYTNLGEREIKGFGEPVRVFSVVLKEGECPPSPETPSSTGMTSLTTREPRPIAVVIAASAQGTHAFFSARVVASSRPAVRHSSAK